MRAYGSKFLVPLHPLNSVKVTNCFMHEPKFSGMFSRNNLPKIKDGACVISLDEKK